MNKSVSLTLLWYIWKWLRFIFMSLNPYVPYDAFNVSLVEKLSWICRNYRLYHEIHQDKTFETTPFWSHYCTGLDDLTLGRMIRTICRFVSRTCRMIWPHAEWSGLEQEPVFGQTGQIGLAQSSAVVLWSWGKCLLKNILKWVLIIVTSLGTFNMTVRNSSTISIIVYYLCAWPNLWVSLPCS